MAENSIAVELVFGSALRRERLLTAGEERRLSQRIERGDLRAKDKLISANLRLVLSLAARVPGQESIADRVQDGAVGLIRAAEKFDWRRGTRFSTYATPWIRQAIQRGAEAHERTIRLPAHIEQHIRTTRTVERSLATLLGREPSSEEIADARGVEVELIELLRRVDQAPASLDEPFSDDDERTLGDRLPDHRPTPSEQVVERELERVVREALSKLPKEQRTVISGRFRDGTSRPAPHRKIGESLGLSEQQVLDLEQEALAALAGQTELAALAQAA